MDFIVFLIQSPDQTGLVSGVSSFFYERNFNIVDCQQFVDVYSKKFFMRLKLDLSGLKTSRKQLESEFQDFSAPKQLNWSVHYTDQLQKMAIMVTTAPHCLYDLLVRHEQKELLCEIPVIISNRPNLESIAEKFRIPFYCLPISNKADKPRQEKLVQSLLKQHHIDLVVLARYMQILSTEFTEGYFGKIINIHHAFLPAFQGANPYRRAYERGVKMIGATAHYATPDLDEGPIIEQNVERVTHEHYPQELTQIGADVERVVLATAVKAHLERRIIITGNKTLVFS